MDKLIFNSSMPRSGSELLQVILHQNPRIYGSPTSPLLEYQFAARGNYALPEVKSQNGELMQKAFINMCAGMAASYYLPITDRPVVCDKNRGWSHYYEWVHQWNPNPKMICMVRDLRSVLSSMEKIYRKTRHMPVGTDNPAELQNMTVGQRVSHWLKSQPVGLALLRTADTFQRSIAKNILYIRYEDLCAVPQETMDRVYAFIGETSYTHDFNNLKKEVEENDTLFGPYGSHVVASKLSLVRADHNDILGKELCARIRKDNEWFFDTFGY